MCDTALASAWERPSVWVHGDMAPSNLLVEAGALHAVIDFGGRGRRRLRLRPGHAVDVLHRSQRDYIP